MNPFSINVTTLYWTPLLFVGKMKRLAAGHLGKWGGLWEVERRLVTGKEA